VFCLKQKRKYFIIRKKEIFVKDCFLVYRYILRRYGPVDGVYFLGRGNKALEDGIESQGRTGEEIAMIMFQKSKGTKYAETMCL